MNIQTNQNAYTLPRENTKRYSFLGRRLTVPYRVKHTPPHNPGNLPLSFLLKQNGNLCLPKTSLVHIRFFLWDAEPTVFLSLEVPLVTLFITLPKMETIRLPCKEWMNEHTVVHLCTGVQCSNTKPQTNNTSNNLDESEIHFVKRKKLNPKDPHHLNDIQKPPKSLGTEDTCDCLRGGEGLENKTAIRKNWGGGRLLW